MATDDSVLSAVRGRVLLVTLNRPSARNALTASMIAQLRSVLADADTDEDIDVVVLTGSDPAFCAGLDLRQLGGSGGNAHSTTDAGIPLGNPWTPLRKPVVGAINGAAVTGGLEFALACDFLIASNRARFADTHSRVGVMPWWGLTHRLPAAVGPGFARRMSTTGNFVDADEALRVGLVTEVVAHEHLVSAALELADTIAGNDQVAVRALLASYRRAGSPVSDAALAAEAATSEAWMEGFEPGEVAKRREAIVDRGRNQAGTQ